MNEMIGLIGDNSIKYIDTLLSILSEGNTAVLLDWRIPLHISLSLLLKTGIKKCYVESSKFKENTVDKDINIVLFESNQKGVEKIPMSFYQRYRMISENNTTDDALVFFSSGTTGKAKGIRLSFFAINHNVDAILDYMQPSKDDKILITKTLTHSSTVVGELFVGLKANVNLFIEPTIASPSFVLRNVGKYGISIWCLNPTLLSIYIKILNKEMYDISSLKYLYISGSIADNKLLKQAKDVIKNAMILNVYGLTEAGPRVTAQRKSSINKPGSVGSPIKGVQVKIISDDGKELPHNCRGIVHVFTLSRMNGYLYGFGNKSLYDEWLNTGDCGYIDEEGDLYIIGRSDNMILQSSHNIFPEEVEILLKCCNLISDCAVFGVKHDIYGERIICFYSSTYDSIEKQLRKYCNDHLAPYEIPSEFIKINSLPYNLNGKLSRNLLKEIYIKRHKK